MNKAEIELIVSGPDGTRTRTGSSLPLLLAEKTPSGVTKEQQHQRWMFPRSKYRLLLDDEGFSAWIQNVSRGSKVNAEVSLRRIGRICQLFQLTQRDLAKMNRGEAGDFLFRL